MAAPYRKPSTRPDRAPMTELFHHHTCLSCGATFTTSHDLHAHLLEVHPWQMDDIINARRLTALCADGTTVVVLSHELCGPIYRSIRQHPTPIEGSVLLPVEHPLYASWRWDRHAGVAHIRGYCETASAAPLAQIAGLPAQLPASCVCGHCTRAARKAGIAQVDQTSVDGSMLVAGGYAWALAELLNTWLINHDTTLRAVVSVHAGVALRVQLVAGMPVPAAITSGITTTGTQWDGGYHTWTRQAHTYTEAAALADFASLAECWQAAGITRPRRYPR